MLIWTIQASVISIIFIFLIHHLFGFLKSTLTVPKIKDLVHSPTQKYEDMFTILNNSSRSSFLPADNVLASISLSKNDNPYDTGANDNEQPMSSLAASSSMKNELKNFLKKQLQPSGAQDIPVNAESFAFPSGGSNSSIGSTPIDLNSF
jgi:hypothetical protein